MLFAALKSEAHKSAEAPGSSCLASRCCTDGGPPGIGGPFAPARGPASKGPVCLPGPPAGAGPSAAGGPSASLGGSCGGVARAKVSTLMRACLARRPSAFRLRARAAAGVGASIIKSARDGKSFPSKTPTGDVLASPPPEGPPGGPPSAGDAPEPERIPCTE